MASAPMVQVLAKDDFTQQSLVSVPDTYLPGPLPPSAVRVRTEVCALTVNNLTYAKLGHLLGWWDVYPLPSNIPEPFNDAAKYGTVCVWGFARVLESNVDDLPVDSLVFGYLPIGTLPVDLILEPRPARRHMAEVSQRRSSLMPIYNRYIIFRRPTETAGLMRDVMGWAALTRPLFLLPWSLNRFVFTWEGENVVSPSAASKEVWSFENARVMAGSTVIVLSGSGKTALCFAQQLRDERPEEHQPAKIVAVTSSATKGFAESTKLYDQVLNYDEPGAKQIRETLGIGSSEKVVLCDFGSRGDAFQRWMNTLKPLCQEIVALAIGSEPKVQPTDVLIQNATERAGMGIFQANASDVIDGGMEVIGEETYWREFMASWRKLAVNGAGIPGISLEWGSGMNDLGRVWDSLCSDKASPEKGYVFEL